jgi:cytochrome P450
MSNDLNRIPGPDPKFLIGNALDFVNTPSHIRLYEYGLAYGDIMRFWLFNQASILINDPGLIEQVLVTDRDLYYKNAPRKAAEPVMGDSLFLSNGKDWEFKRRNHPFSAAQIDNYFEQILPTIQKTTNSYLQILQPSSTPKSVELFGELVKLSFQIFGLTVLGSEMDSSYFDAFTQLMQEMNNRGGQPFLPYPLSLNPKFWLQRQHWNNFIEEQIHQRQQQPDRQGIDLLSFAIQGTELSTTQLREELSTTFTAGTRNVAEVVTAVLFLCAKNPEEMQKLQSEIRLFLVECGSEFHLADINLLNYLDLVVKEALRLYPAVPLFIREVIPGQSPTLGGYTLPEKTQIFISSWSFHRNPKHWQNPNDFMPERFTNVPPPFHYFPFGAGPRQCIGMAFTLLCTKVILVNILSQYSVELEPSSIFDTQYFSGTIMPREGVKVKLSKK